MELSNCKSCGCLMLHRKEVYCGVCQKERDQCHRMVRSFLSRRPGSTLLDVHRETGIAVPALLEYIREFSPASAGSGRVK